MRILESLTALVMIGEALALFVGMVLTGDVHTPWRTPLNITLLGLDVLTGVILLLALWKSEPCGWLMWVSGGVAVLSHAFRVWQTIAGAVNPFCFNTPLSIVNALKLAGLALPLLICIPTNLGLANR
jgi:hypothetical protein